MTHAASLSHVDHSCEHAQRDIRVQVASVASVQIPVLLLAGCVTLNKSLDLSVLGFSHVQNGDDSSAYLTEL